MKTAGNKVIHTQKFKFPEIQISKKNTKNLQPCIIQEID